MRAKTCHLLSLMFAGGLLPAVGGTSEKPDFSPGPEEQQVPLKMHAALKTVPRITVGREGADIIGNDNRALQAAVDYVANLGGGIVEIGAGEFLMRDSRNTPSQEGTSASWLLVFAVATTLLVWLLHKVGLTSLIPMLPWTLIGPIL